MTLRVVSITDFLCYVHARPVLFSRNFSHPVKWFHNYLRRKWHCLFFPCLSLSSILFIHPSLSLFVSLCLSLSVLVFVLLVSRLLVSLFWWSEICLFLTAIFFSPATTRKLSDPTIIPSKFYIDHHEIGYKLNQFWKVILFFGFKIGIWMNK